LGGGGMKKKKEKRKKKKKGQKDHRLMYFQLKNLSQWT